MKYINAGMILLFVLAAAVQYTDPDPLVWIAVYGISALLCLLYAIGRFPMIAGSLFAACCMIASLVLFWKFLTTDPVVRDEGLLHGAAGLFLVFLWISSLAWSKQHDRSALT